MMWTFRAGGGGGTPSWLRTCQFSVYIFGWLGYPAWDRKRDASRQAGIEIAQYLDPLPPRRFSAVPAVFDCTCFLFTCCLDIQMPYFTLQFPPIKPENASSIIIFFFRKMMNFVLVMANYATNCQHNLPKGTSKGKAKATWASQIHAALTFATLFPRVFLFSSGER